MRTHTHETPDRWVVALAYEEVLDTGHGESLQAHIQEVTVKRPNGGEATRQRKTNYVQGCRHPGAVADLCVECRRTCCASCLCKLCRRGVCPFCALRTVDGGILCVRCGAIRAGQQDDAELDAMWMIVLGTLGIVAE